MLTPDIVRLSPNYTDAPVNGQTVIVHCTRSGKKGNPSEFIGTLNYLTTPGNPSSHLVISRAGQTARLVHDDRRAHHAAEDNDNTWGIEVEQPVESDGFTPEELDELELAFRHYHDEYGVPYVHARTSTEPGFIGHEETAQGRRDGKSDPGRLFDWDAFMARFVEPPVEETKETAAMWVTLANRPEHVPFRTYIIEADGSGMLAYFVPSLAAHLALEESKAAGPLRELSIETLREFNCSPDPMLP